jgi:hypothetical protein
MRAKHFLLVLMAVCAPGISYAEDTIGQTLDRSGLEFGGRYWYSTGRIGYNYYGDTTTTLLVSKLTYDQLTGNAGEFYFRGDTKWGFFVKGFAGAGGISGGRLTDEDLPFPGFPYSATTSTASGTLSYGTVDLGYSVIRQPGFRLGGFVGYGRWNEAITASGCTQIAANPFVCPVPVPASIAVVKETDNWDLLRVGVTADVMLGEHVKLTADAAYVRASQKATDDHFFTFGIDPASGTGQGFQIDAIVSYQFTSAFNIGIGGRWWHLDTNAIDAFQQLETYHADRYGVFVQGGLKFN